MQVLDGQHLKSAAKLVKLALALHRKEVSDIPDAERSESMQLLLRLANDDTQLMQWAMEITGASKAELHRSCIWFIEQMFFMKGADCYGVLGLNPWATPADIKEHYRLLIRIFHPDRGLVDQHLAESYSARINQAYAELKLRMPETAEKESRKSSVVTVHQKQSNKTAGRIYNRPLSWTSRLTWLTPAKVMLFLGLLSGLVLMLLFRSYNNSELSTYDVLTGAHQSIASPESANDAATQVDISYLNVGHDSGESLSPLNDPAVDHLANPGAIPLTISKADDKPQDNNPVKQNLPVNETANKPQGVIVGNSAHAAQDEKKISKAKQLAGRGAELVNEPAALIQEPGKATEQPVLKLSLANEVSANQASTVGVTDKAAIELPNDRELRELVAQFMDSYQRGDIRAFMQLFAERVDADEEGGRLGLENTYADFFRRTKMREMVIRDLQWKRKDNILLGDAGYKTNILRQDGSEIVKGSGTFKFKVIKSGSKPLIVGFYHAANSD